MNDNEVFASIIEFMISKAKNKQYITNLKIMLDLIKNKKHIEEFNHPRFLANQMGYWTLFPLSDEVYRELAKELKNEHKF